MEKVKTTITMADLQRLDAEEKWVEVEDGAIIESENVMTVLHMIIIQNLFRLLDPFVRANKLGEVYIDGVRYILAGSPENVRRARKPDFSFMRAGRIPAEFDWSGDFVGAPDFAVEVASPGQTASDLLARLAAYLKAGSEEAWLIYANSKTVYQYRRTADEPSIYRSGAAIDTSALFPGLVLMVDDLFVTPQG